MAYVKTAGSHWQGPLSGSEAAAGGLCTDLPAELIARRDFVYHFVDFIGTDDYDSTAWTEAAIGAAAAQSVGIEADIGNGQLLVNAGTTNSTGVATCFTGTGNAGEYLGFGDLAALAGAPSQKLIAWEARVKVDNNANGFAFVGLTDSDTSPLTTAGAFSVAGGLCAFRFVQNGSIQFRVANGGVGTNSTFPFIPSNDSYVRLGARMVPVDSNVALGQAAQVFVNGRFVEQVGSVNHLPATNVCPTFAAVNGAGALIDLRCDYFWVCIQR